MAIYFLTHIISAFTYKPIVTVVIEILTRNDSLIYDLLLEEFKDPSSEFKINLLEKLSSEENNQLGREGQNIFRKRIFDFLNVKEHDFETLHACCLIYVILRNGGLLFLFF